MNHHTLLKSCFAPSFRTSPSSFFRELGKLLSAEFDSTLDSAVISNSAKLCLCLVQTKNGTKKTRRNLKFAEFPIEKLSEVGQMALLYSRRQRHDGGVSLPSLVQRGLGKHFLFFRCHYFAELCLTTLGRHFLLFIFIKSECQGSGFAACQLNLIQ